MAPRDFHLALLFLLPLCLVANGLNFVIAPDLVFPRQTDQLTLNCSLPNTTEHRQSMDTVLSLIISYSLENGTHGFKEIVHKRAYQYSSLHLDNKPSQTSSARGKISFTDTPFLELELFNPYQTSNAWYKCEATGMDPIGHPVVVSQVIPVRAVVYESTQDNFTSTDCTQTFKCDQGKVQNNIRNQGTQIGLHLAISPDHMNPGQTQDLSLNCTLPNTTQRRQAMDTVLSLILSYRFEHEPLGFREMVYTKFYGSDRTNSYRLPTRSGSYKGRTSFIDTPYLEVNLLNFTQTSNAWYKCEATGMDAIGHPVVLSQVVQVPYATHGPTQGSAATSTSVQMLTMDQEELQNKVTIQNSQIGLSLVISPDVVIAGQTHDLSMNCSLPNATVHGKSLTAVSLIMSYSFENDTHGFKEMVYTKGYGHPRTSFKSCNVPSQSSRTRGMINFTGPSYLEVNLSDPTQTSDVWYKCEATGMDDGGHPVVVSQVVRVPTVVQQGSTKDTSIVSGTQTPCVDNSDLQNKVMDQQAQISEQTSRLRQLELRLSAMSNTLDLLVKNQSPLQQPNQLTDVNEAFYISNSTGGTRWSKYYLFRHAYLSNPDVAQAICYLYGGYLVEVNDKSEHDFIKLFLNNLGVHYIAIFTGVRRSVTADWACRYNPHANVYTDWGNQEPSMGECLALHRGYAWKMASVSCDAEFTFMCEVPYLRLK